MNQMKSCFELRAALNKCLITQSEMARICGVKPQQVWRWCDGYTSIPVYVWSILALWEGCSKWDVKRGKIPDWEVRQSDVFRGGKNYLQMAKRFHPDLSDRDTTAEMQMINKFRSR